MCCTYDSFSTSAPDTTTHKQPPETTSLSTSSDPGLTPITQTTKIPVFTSPPTTTTDGGVATTAAPAPAPTIVHTTNPLDKTTFVPTTETVTLVQTLTYEQIQMCHGGGGLIQNKGTRFPNWRWARYFIIGADVVSYTISGNFS